jgi:hypothetical protein
MLIVPQHQKMPPCFSPLTAARCAAESRPGSKSNQHEGIKAAEGFGAEERKLICVQTRHCRQCGSTRQGSCRWVLAVNKGRDRTGLQQRSGHLHLSASLRLTPSPGYTMVWIPCTSPGEELSPESYKQLLVLGGCNWDATCE